MGFNKCSICKTKILEIRLDKEFDQINNPTSIDTINGRHNINSKYTKKVYIDFDNIGKPGITLKNNEPGVKIVDLKKSEICYNSDLKINDIILHINNIPCLHHKFTIELIENLFASKKKCIFEILQLNN
tara:strand:- start:56 stop:442 length:387 start_codon:yes stop_codon:yes gene_type:complete